MRAIRTNSQDGSFVRSDLRLTPHPSIPPYLVIQRSRFMEDGVTISRIPDHMRGISTADLRVIANEMLSVADQLDYESEGSPL